MAELQADDGAADAMIRTERAERRLQALEEHLRTLLAESRERAQAHEERWNNPRLDNEWRAQERGSMIVSRADADRLEAILEDPHASE